MSPSHINVGMAEWWAFSRSGITTIPLTVYGENILLYWEEQLCNSTPVLRLSLPTLFLDVHRALGVIEVLTGDVHKKTHLSSLLLPVIVPSVCLIQKKCFFKGGRWVALLLKYLYMDNYLESSWVWHQHDKMVVIGYFLVTMTSLATNPLIGLQYQGWFHFCSMGLKSNQADCGNHQDTRVTLVQLGLSFWSHSYYSSQSCHLHEIVPFSLAVLYNDLTESELAKKEDTSRTDPGWFL